MGDKFGNEHKADLVECGACKKFVKPEVVKWMKVAYSDFKKQDVFFYTTYNILLCDSCVDGEHKKKRLKNG